MTHAHWLIIALVTLGAGLRLLAWLAYQPALLYTDSFYYLWNVGPLNPQYLDPIGYPLFVLRPLLPLGGIALVAAVQHVVGICMGIAVYALLRKLGVRTWLSALGALPVLVDAYQVQIEQNIMSDLWLEALLIVLLWLLLGWGVPTPRRAALAGVVIGLAMTIRMVAFPLIIPVLAYLVLAGREWRIPGGWRRIVGRSIALVGCFALIVAAYATYFHAKAGVWGLNTASGNSIYGRTANVVDCPALHLDPVLAQLCPAQPRDQRRGPEYYAHMDGDPNWPGVIPAGKTKYDLEREFAWRVIEKQPLAVARAVIIDFGKGFTPGFTGGPTDPSVVRWQFQTEYPIYAGQNQSMPDAIAQTQGMAIQYGGSAPRVNVVLATVLRAYQLDGGYVPGVVLGLCGLVGAAGIWCRRWGARGVCALLLGMTIALLGTSALFEFSWRYQLPGLVLLPMLGVIGVSGLLGARQPGRKLLGTFPDPVDQAAIDEFVSRYGRLSMAPVTVVIAAYEEQDGIGAVLADLPRQCCGLEVNVLVVVDGGTDDTARVATDHGALVCEAPVNRGQGAALRLGYWLATRGGAEYVVTTDADGQYVGDELPLAVAPLVADEADFVTGSRRLGTAPDDDRVRWLGVRVFAFIVSVLTGRRLTDTSFGARAVRTDVLARLRLRQPQYQASELLISVLASGARVMEVPMTMRIRSAGTTKKGTNLRYGLRYARVITRTWLREYPLRWFVRRQVAIADPAIPG